MADALLKAAAPDHVSAVHMLLLGCNTALLLPYLCRAAAQLQWPDGTRSKVHLCYTTDIFHSGIHADSQTRTLSNPHDVMQ